MDFVIGHPRSGTAFVNYLLNEAGGAVSRHEYLMDENDFAFVRGATDYYEGRIGSPEIKRMLAHYRAMKRVDIEVSWKHTWALPPLIERFPSARIVHLVRDPRDNVRSCFNLGMFGALLAGVANDALPRIRRDDWDRLNAFERNCAFWTETHRLALAMERRKGKYLRVRLEDLSRDDEIARLFAFLDLELPSAARVIKVKNTLVDTVAYVKHQMEARAPEQLPPYAAWPAARKRALRSLCGELARRFGYGGL